MRLLATLTANVIILVATGSAHASDCGKMPVMSATTSDGKKVELVLDSVLVGRTPSWLPGASDPPISISRATELSLSWAKNHYSQFDSVEIREISLTSLGCVGSSNQWYYVVEFIPVIDGARKYSPGNWVAVLMDGTVIGATIKPASD